MRRCLRYAYVVKTAWIIPAAFAALLSIFPHGAVPADRLSAAQGGTKATEPPPTKAPAPSEEATRLMQEAVRVQADESLAVNRKLAEYTAELARFTKWLVAVTFLGSFILFATAAYQAWVTRDTARRQLRAYVAVETGNVGNVANPEPTTPGQPAPPETNARITNALIGPVAWLTTRNVGQTPANSVRTWANICLREFPLTWELPPRPPALYEAESVLGPHIVSGLAPVW